MKYCTECGKQLPDEAVFCTGCGKPQQAPAYQGEPQAQMNQPEAAQQWTPQWGPPGYQRPGFQQGAPEQPRPVQQAPAFEEEKTRSGISDMGLEETTRLTAADMPENQKQLFDQAVDAASMGTEETTRLTAADMPEFQAAAFQNAMGQQPRQQAIHHVAGQQPSGQAEKAPQEFRQPGQPGHVLTGQGWNGPTPPISNAAPAREKKGGKGLVILFSVLSVLGAAAIALFLILGLKYKKDARDYEQQVADARGKMADVDYAEELSTVILSTLTSEDAFSDAENYGLYNAEGKATWILTLENGSDTFAAAKGMNGNALLEESNDNLSGMFGPRDHALEYQTEDENGQPLKWFIALSRYPNSVYVFLGTDAQPDKYELYPDVCPEYQTR